MVFLLEKVSLFLFSCTVNIHLCFEFLAWLLDSFTVNLIIVNFYSYLHSQTLPRSIFLHLPTYSGPVSSPAQTAPYCRTLQQAALRKADRTICRPCGIKINRSLQALIIITILLKMNLTVRRVLLWTLLHLATCHLHYPCRPLNSALAVWPVKLHWLDTCTNWDFP